MKQFTIAKRRLMLSDAIVLIAATAGGLALVRCLWDIIIIDYFRSLPDWSLRLYVLMGPIFIIPVVPLMATWAVALMALSLRQPRLKMRFLLAQPGTAACAVAPCIMILCIAQCLAACAIQKILFNECSFSREVGEKYTSYLTGFFSIQFETFLGAIGTTVAIVWMLLGWTRMERPEPNWIERAGRVLGILWIMAGLGQWWGEICLDHLRSHLIFH